MKNVEEVLEERGKTYGSYLDNALAFKALHDTMRSRLISNPSYQNAGREKQAIIDHTVAVVCMKMGRLATGDVMHLDNLTDIAGYAKITIDALQQKER